MTDGTPSVDGGALLAAIAARGDRDAFAALFAHFAPRVKGYLLRLGLPNAQAEELAQETMLTVWRRAEQFDPATGGAAAWIFTIARNLRVDALRRDRLAPRLEIMAEEPPPPPAADAVIATVQHSDRVRAALATLPPEQAEVVRLSFFDDRPHAEIEQALGIPLGTVKSRLRLAMTRLRALLDDIR
ncbi:MAG TPA: sigma-70 family RNA polymerase sigma factor [Roseomonas sp.]|nr:sigma-70 family RNA polymerase sigma factor [Roseomonas sp.]